MKVSKDLLRCIAKVMVKHGGNIVGAGIVGNVAIEIWESWEKSKKSEADKKAEIANLAQQPAAKLQKDVADIVREVAPQQTPEQRYALSAYLQHVPSMVRRSLKRPSD